MSSNVHGLVNVKKYDVSWRFFSCLRRENALLSVIHRPNAVIPTHYLVFAVGLSCAKWYVFLYSSVFYTINHLDIYIYRFTFQLHVVSSALGSLALNDFDEVPSIAKSTAQIKWSIELLGPLHEFFKAFLLPTNQTGIWLVTSVLN